MRSTRGRLHGLRLSAAILHSTGGCRRKIRGVVEVYEIDFTAAPVIVGAKAVIFGVVFEALLLEFEGTEPVGELDEDLPVAS